MKVLIFGGQSPSNKRWISHLKELLQLKYEDAEIICHTYDYWVKGLTKSNDAAQADYEVELAIKAYQSIPFDLVIGKSFGAYMSISCVKSCKFSKLLLIGVPISEDLFVSSKFIELIKNTDIPTMCLINGNDSVSDAKKLDKIVKLNVNISQVLFTPGGDHKYKKETILKEATQFLQNN